MTVDVELTIGQEVIPGFGSLSFYSAAADAAAAETSFPPAMTAATSSLFYCFCAAAAAMASAAERPSLLNGGRPESSGRLLFIVDFSVFSEYIPDQPHRSYLLPQ